MGGKKDADDRPTGTYRTVSRAAYFEKIGYKPHAKQQLYHDSSARFRIPVCGRRFGKSKMAGTDIQPKLLVPRRRGWIVGPTYDLGEKEFRVVWDDMIVKLGLGRDKRVKKAYNKKQGTMFIEFPWQTRLEVRSADHPDNLVGESLDWVIMSEAAKHKKDTFERYIRAALADRRGSADFPTTPEGFNWLHELWQQGQDPDLPDYQSWQFPSWDNPIVYPGGRMDPEIRLIERTTAEAWFLQEIAADFTAFVGKIFREWQESIHVRKHVYNPEWPNYIAFDWGFTSPMAAVEFQVDPMDRVYVWREHYKPYTVLEEFLHELRTDQHTSQVPTPPGYRIDLCFGDAADPGAAKTVSEKFHPCLADPRSKSGTENEKGQDKRKSGWREGVDLVCSLLKVREASDNFDLTEMVSQLDLTYAESLRTPGLTVDHACKNLIKEFNNYRAPDNGRGDRNPREAAQPYADHALDALRYGLMHIFKLGCRGFLSDVYPPESFTESNLPQGGYFQMDDLRF